MGPNTRTRILEDQLLDIRKRIVVMELTLECARIQSSRFGDSSDLGWLFSINASAAGTVLAVLNGQRAGRWSAQAADLQRELLHLVIDQKIIEHELAGFRLPVPP